MSYEQRAGHLTDGIEDLEHTLNRLRRDLNWPRGPSDPSPVDVGFDLWLQADEMDIEVDRLAADLHAAIETARKGVAVDVFGVPEDLYVPKADRGRGAVEHDGHRYEMSAAFVTDRPLTTSEADLIVGALLAQINEPVDENGSRATYRVTTATTTRPSPIPDAAPGGAVIVRFAVNDDVAQGDEAALVHEVIAEAADTIGLEGVRIVNVRLELDPVAEVFLNPDGTVAYTSRDKW